MSWQKALAECGSYGKLQLQKPIWELGIASTIWKVAAACADEIVMYFRRPPFLQTVFYSISRVQCGSHCRPCDLWVLGKCHTFTPSYNKGLDTGLRNELVSTHWHSLSAFSVSRCYDTPSFDLAVQAILGRGILIHVAALLDNLFYGHPTALLYFVMVMCPLCMNLVQVGHVLPAMQFVLITQVDCCQDPCLRP